MTAMIDCDDDDDDDEEGDKCGEGGTVFSCKRAMSGNVSPSPKRTLSKGIFQIVQFYKFKTCNCTLNNICICSLSNV